MHSRSVVARRAGVVVATALFCVAGPSHPAGQPSTAALQWKPSLPSERTLRGGERHEYTVTLDADQALGAVVEQRGVDVLVKVIGPAGALLAEVDSPNGTRGPEPVFVVAPTPGEYRLVVEALDASSPPGQYAVSVTSARVAERLAFDQDIDRDLVARDADALHFDAAQGHVVALAVKPTGTSVEVVLHGPTGERVALRDPDSLAETVWLTVLVPTTGRYRVVVRNLAREGAGRYQIRLDTPRAPSATDAVLIQADAEEAKGAELRDQPRQIGAAVEHYARAIEALRTLGARERLVAALLRHADALVQLNQFDRAMVSIDEAHAVASAIGNTAGQVRALIKDGVARALSGRPAEALERFQRALAIATPAGLRAHEVTLVNNIGQLHSEAGRFADAVPFLERAATQARAAGNSESVISALSNLAGVRQAMGSLQLALDGLREALQLSRETSARDEESRILNNLGSLYESLGQQDVALDHHRQALDLARSLDDARLQATALTNIASLEAAAGRTTAALASYEDALALRRASRDVAGEAGTLYNMGNVANMARDLPKALDYLTQAAVILRRLDESANLAIVLGTTAKVYFRMGDRPRALATYDESLALSRAMGDRRSVSITLSLVGQVLRENGDLSGARTAFEESLAIKETLRRSVTVAALRTSLFATMRQSYDEYIDLLMRQHDADPNAGHDRVAFGIAERARARTLLDTVMAGNVDLDAQLDQSLLTRRQEAMQLVNAAAARLATAERTSSGATDSAQREVTSSLAALADIEAAIKREHPEYAAVAQLSQATVADVQRAVVDDDSVLLEYSVGAERSVLWVIDPDRARSHPIPKRAELDPLVRQYRESLMARAVSVPGEDAGRYRARVAAADREAARLGAVLFRTLLGPAQDAFDGRRLLIVPDGPLEAVPFAALPLPSATSAPIPLIARHEVVLLPSAATLEALRSRAAGRAEPRGKTVAILADPVFSLADARVPAAMRRSATLRPQEADESLTRAAAGVGVGEPNGPLPRLPYARAEADAILATAGAANTTRFIGFEATVLNASAADLRRRRILHVASHAFANQEHPELSGIVLSLVGKDGRPRDGFLRLHQIYNLDLAATDLAVLSACQTAVGRDVAGEGVVGLTRGFLHAGATSVVSSLWSVNDQSTAELMRHFYTGLLGPQGMTKSAALRAAQVALSLHPRWQAPYYWAAFGLFGDWR